MHDLQKIVETFHAARKAGTRCVLATVVHIEGSTYRRTGARALFLPDSSNRGVATVVGLVSGGCLENDLMSRADDVLENGTPLLVRYDSRSSDDLIFGLGLGCRGVVEVLLERVDQNAPGPMDWLAACIEQRETRVIATVIASDATAPPALASRWLFDARGRSTEPSPRPEWDACIAGAARRLLAPTPETNRSPLSKLHLILRKNGTVISVERIPRQIQLLVIGAGPDAPMLIDLARSLGWRVVVVDPRRAFARSELLTKANRIVQAEPGQNCGITLDGDTVAVIMSHHYRRDREALRWLLPSPVRYLGLLGPRTRAKELLDDLAKDDFQPTGAMLSRLSAPAGLDIGGDGPQVIAVSMVAEIQAVLSGRQGGLLRDRKAAIHADDP